LSSSFVLEQVQTVTLSEVDEIIFFGTISTRQAQLFQLRKDARKKKIKNILNSVYLERANFTHPCIEKILLKAKKEEDEEVKSLDFEIVDLRRTCKCSKMKTEFCKMNGVSKIFREFKEKTLLKCNEEFNHIKFIVHSSTTSILSEY
jgi:hypothetical protein